jgi:SanA protein
MRRKIVLVFLIVIACLLGSIAGAPVLMRRASAGRLYGSTADIPHREVGLVLGCSRLSLNGRPSPLFYGRLQAAIELFQAHKVDYLLVSGKNHARGDTEATDLRDGLLQAGIPANRIYCDCAGLRTLDSIVRARDVFGLKQVTLVSQEFHNQRAIFLSDHEGLDAIAYNAILGEASNGNRRERLAKVKAVLDVYLLHTKPHFLGPRVSIGVDAPTTCPAGQ